MKKLVNALMLMILALGIVGQPAAASLPLQAAALYPNAFGNIRDGFRIPAAPTLGPYLPGTPAFAGGFRRLIAGYSGAAVQVTRSSDSTAQDFTFAAGSDELDYAAIDAFVGAGVANYSRFYDQTGSGTYATGTNTGPAMSSLTDIRMGKSRSARVSYDIFSSNNDRFWTLPSGLSFSANSVSAFTAYRPQSSVVQGMAFQLGTTTSGVVDLYTELSPRVGNNNPSNSKLGYTVHAGQAPASGTSLGANGMPRSQPSVVGVVAGATASTYYLDDRTFAGPTPTSATVTGGGVVGSSQFSGYAPPADFNGFAAYATPLVPADVQKVRAAMSANFPTRGARQIIFDGDSITDGIGATYGQNYVLLTEPSLNYPADITNIGVPGQTAANINTTFSGRAATMYKAALTRNVYFLLAGTNDIGVSGATPAATFSSIQAICSAAKAAGYKVVIATVLPRGTAQNQADIATLNTSIRGLGSAYVDAIADFAADSIMGNASNLTSPYYFDQIHPSNAGYARLAPIAASAINSVLQ